MPSTPTNLRDIYNYLGQGWSSGANDMPWADPRLQSAGPVDWDDSNSAFSRTTDDYGRPQWALKDGGFLGNLNRQYAGAATLTNQRPGGDSSYQMGWDMSKLPKTRFGTVDMTVPVGHGTKIKNKALVYDDPVYGKITHRGNVHTGSNALVGPGLMALLSMGAGSLVGATGGAAAANSFRQGMSGARLLQGLANGGNPWQAAGSALLGASGLPSWAQGPSSMALNQLFRRRGRR